MIELIHTNLVSNLRDDLADEGYSRAEMNARDCEDEEY
jgi:hypothetical protein